MKVSFITTVFNEEKTIGKLLDSLSNQSHMPNEIIIVDGNSQDGTKAVILQYMKKFPQVSVRLFIKKGNRSVGRNEAIKNAKGDIIAISDAGCILERHWLENLLKPLQQEFVDVVAGYYKGIGRTLFEKSLIPYVLVMPDNIDSRNFLPATRSMALRKRVFEKVGGFTENLSHNEDYAFSKKLVKSGVKIVFTEKAVVYWYPRTTFLQAFNMFFRFSYGDAEAGILRSKVAMLFIRYIIGILMVFYVIVFHSLFFLLILIAGIIVYWLWAVWKNMRYVRNIGAYYTLPLLQFTADVAVICGSFAGFIKRLLKK